MRFCICAFLFLVRLSLASLSSHVAVVSSWRSSVSLLAGDLRGVGLHSLARIHTERSTLSGHSAIAPPAHHQKLLYFHFPVATITYPLSSVAAIVCLAAPHLISALTPLSTYNPALLLLQSPIAAIVLRPPSRTLHQTRSQGAAGGDHSGGIG